MYAKIKDFPRTRRSSRALAAIRPWGIPEDGAAWEVGFILPISKKNGKRGQMR